jgi:HNH endonuclease/AP2 domain
MTLRRGLTYRPTHEGVIAPALTQQRLHELLQYDAHTGRFTRRVARGNCPAGWSCDDTRDQFGYVRFSVDGKNYRAHRLAWLYVYGEWPEHSIDHINGDKADNRIENLRDVSHHTNMQNQRAATRANKTGFLGVCFHKRKGRYHAQINAGGRVRSIGYFSSPEEAHAAYVEEKRRLHPGSTL